MLWERDSVRHHAAKFTSDVRGLKQGKHAFCVCSDSCALCSFSCTVSVSSKQKSALRLSNRCFTLTFLPSWVFNKHCWRQISQSFLWFRLGSLSWSILVANNSVTVPWSSSAPTASPFPLHHWKLLPSFMSLPSIWKYVNCDWKCHPCPRNAGWKIELIITNTFLWFREAKDLRGTWGPPRQRRGGVRGQRERPRGSHGGGNQRQQHGFRNHLRSNGRRHD